MKQLRILDRIFLFFTFRAHVLSRGLDLVFLRLLPSCANSARSSSAGSTRTNLLELCRTCGGIVDILDRAVCWRSELDVAGRELNGVLGLRRDRVEELSDRTDADRVRYGITSLVEGRSPRPSVGRGVLGLLGVELLVPTLDRPVKRYCMPTRALSILD
jgi:hypothetical protein